MLLATIEYAHADWIVMFDSVQDNPGNVQKNDHDKAVRQYLMHIFKALTRRA